MTSSEIDVSNFHPAQRSEFSAFTASVDAVVERLNVAHRVVAQSVARWIALAAERASLESDLLTELDSDLERPSFDDAVQRFQTEVDARLAIERLGFRSPEPAWVATDTVPSGLEVAAIAAKKAWATLESLPPRSSPGPRPTAPEPPCLPAPPERLPPRRPTDSEANVVTWGCGGVSVLAGIHATSQVLSDGTLGVVGALELTVFLASAIGVVAMFWTLRRRDAASSVDHDAYVAAIAQHREALEIYESQRVVYEHAVLSYRSACAAYDEVAARNQHLLATRTACQGVIAQAALRLRSAHRRASQREEAARTLVDQLRPLRDFDADPNRGGFVAAMSEYRQDLLDTVYKIVNGPSVLFGMDELTRLSR